MTVMHWQLHPRLPDAKCALEVPKNQEKNKD